MKDTVTTKASSASSARDSFIRLSPVLDILKAAIWTGKLGDERPVSVMLIAEQESCKTECLKYFTGTSTLRYVSDLSSRGLISYRKEIESGHMRHLILLDLVRILSHNRSTSERTVQTLASLMEEGESETSDAGGRESWANFPRIGCLMAITPSYFKSKRGRWRQTGFLTRFVPVSFSYSAESVKAVHEAISNGHKIPAPTPERLPELPVGVKCSREHSKMLGKVAEELGVKMKTYGFRYHRVLRTLAKAQACIEGCGTVEDSHILKVIRWSEFFTEKEVIL